MTSTNKFEQDKYRLLQELLDQAQVIKDAQKLDLAINEIAVTILRSRPLCRQFNGTPLIGVYQEIYAAVKDRLMSHLRQNLSIPIPNIRGQDIRDQTGTKYLQPDYLYQLQTRFFRQVLDDGQLKKMGLAAQKFLLNSELRTYGLTELIRAIKFSGRVARPHIGKFSSSLYQILYEEAITETFAYVCLNIDLYDPNRGDRKFMNWVNFKLDKQILKCYEKHKKYSRHELLSFQELEQIKQPSTTPDLAQLLQKYLDQDPDGLLKTTHIRYRPDASFRKIALAKLSGQGWSEISQRLDIPIPTLSSFYNRWCRRFAPLFETELTKHF